VKYCSECGQPWPQEELARFGDRLICSNCKIAYAQKLREGVASAATFTYGLHRDERPSDPAPSCPASRHSGCDRPLPKWDARVADSSAQS
jgi:hypothetical protein